MIAWILAIVVLGFVGKLIYDVQQNKKKINEINETALTEAEKFREQWQNLAGIGKPKNEIDPEIWKYIADKVSKDGFPESDPTIPVATTKITTIDLNSYEDNDPLASVPMSRVSNSAKQKMAEIAKQDINNQLEQNTEKFAAIFPEGVNSIDTNDQRLGVEFVKPKRKYTKRKKDTK